LDYEQAIQLRPDQYQPFYNRAKLRLAQGNSQDALKDYAEAIRLLPDTANQAASDVYLDRGQLFASLGNLTSALSDFEQAATRNPKNALAFYNRGNIRFQQEEYTAALSDFTQAVQLDSQFGKAFYGLGITQIMTEAREAGCISLKQAQKLGYADAATAIQQYCQP